MYEQDETMADPPEMVHEEDAEKEPTASDGTFPTEEDGTTETESNAPAVDPSSASQSADPAPQDLELDQKNDSELESIRRELNLLRAQMDGQSRAMQRIGLEYAEFCDLYPDQSPDELPDEVWESVRRGIPLSAAYALAERRKFRTEEKARTLNLENRQRSSGALGQGTSGYLSPDEVRAMSQAEVRANYQTILLSMQKWH